VTSGLRCESPIDGRVVCERPFAGEGEIATALQRARQAQAAWRRVPLEERAAVCTAFVDAFVARRDEIAREITLQMGRPIAFAGGEVGGLEERARAMIRLAPEALADVVPEPKPGFRRFVRREPLGVVLTIAPWNYPYLTAVNSVVPALLAGNAVVLRHSAQTPLCAERFAEAFAAAGLPAGVFQALHADHAATERLVASPEVDFVAFTGSVEAGRRLQSAMRARFAGMGLELGGKDPAYVRADADLTHAVEGLVDGAYFNSGQSCCGIERIYVARECFDEFVSAAAEAVSAYRLGADWVRRQVRAALAAGARGLVDPARFPGARDGTPYLAPQLLVDVDHAMSVMREESFGPVVGVMPVADDDEAVARMNDSDFGLTASVWTRDEAAALAIGARVETGTFFMNRCDYLDPALAWTGVKDSGRGCTLSRVGFEHLTRPKSFHLRTLS